MGVRRPDWWCYPERCQNGHEWGPGLITVSWVLCDCPPAQAVRERAGGGPAGHMAVFCNVKGCRSAWYRPRHEPGTLLRGGHARNRQQGTGPGRAWAWPCVICLWREATCWLSKGDRYLVEPPR
jgi:hypothetical protein